MEKPTHTNPTRRKKVISMHENVPVWADCCSCEAEPYWQALADEEECAAKDSARRAKKLRSPTRQDGK